MTQFRHSLNHTFIHPNHPLIFPSSIQSISWSVYLKSPHQSIYKHSHFLIALSNTSTCISPFCMSLPQFFPSSKLYVHVLHNIFHVYCLSFVILYLVYYFHSIHDYMYMYIYIIGCTQSNRSSLQTITERDEKGRITNCPFSRSVDSAG